MSEGYENTLNLKDVSDASDEQKLPVVFWTVSVFLTKLTDCTTHIASAFSGGVLLNTLCISYGRTHGQVSFWWEDPPHK